MPDTLSTPVKISRDPVPVIFRRVADDHEAIRSAWGAFERAVGLPGRKFFGVFDAATGEYWLCAQFREGDDPELLRAEVGTIPGGRYLRARLEGEAPGVYERIPAGFDQMESTTQRDHSRPVIEFYRSLGVIDLLLPVSE